MPVVSVRMGPAWSLSPARTMVLLCVPDLLSKAPSLRLTDPLSPFGFHQQPPRLPAVLPRKRGCPPHLGP